MNGAVRWRVPLDLSPQTAREDCAAFGRGAATGAGNPNSLYMASILNHRRVKRATESMSQHPSRVLDALVMGGVGLVLLLTLFQMGGYLPFGSTMTAPTWVLIAVGVLHVLARLLRSEAGGIHPATLIPLPFLAVAFFSQAWVSGWSLTGDLKLALWLEAYLIFLLVLHSARARGTQFAMLTIVALVMAAGFYAAFRQAYFEPHWFPFPERLRDSVYGNSFGGYIAVPDVFAGWVLLLVPFFLIGAGGRRLKGPVRILLGFMAFASFFALTVAGSLEALLIFAAALFLTPFFTVATWRQRRSVFGKMVLVVVLLGALVWVTASPIKTRLVQIAETRETTREEVAGAAMAMFQERPLEGYGVGGFPHQWDAFAPADTRLSPRYAHNDWMELAAEAGVLGLLAVVVPLGGFLFLGFRTMMKLPFHQLTEEEAIRLARREVEGRHRGRRRRRHKKKDKKPKGKMPGQRILIPAMSLGLIGFGAYSWFSFSAQMPLPLFTAAVVAAVLARAVSGREWEPEKRFAPRTLASAGPVALGAGIYLLALPAFEAQSRTFAGQEALAEALANPRQLFFQPEPLLEAEEAFAEAAALHPRNHDALAGLAAAILNRIYLEEDVTELGQRALPVTREAIALQPTRGVFHLYHAMALGYSGAPWEDVETHFEKALYQAPRRAQTHVAYAQFMLLNGGTRDEVMKLVERALELDPNYSAARDLRARLIL